MKKTIRNLFGAVMVVAASLQTHAQGFVYDQQSATGPVSVQGNGNADGLDIQEDSPLMQSFTPSLSAIGFVQFEFWDIPGNGNNGATVYVNLWTGSTRPITATFLGSTTPIYMPNGFVNSGLGIAGITNFSFSTPIGLTPGQTYYLQPVVASGDDPWDIITIGDTYPNGQLYGKTGGFFQPSTDFWFREGVVPEPSAFALIGLSSILAWTLKRRSKLFVLFGIGVLFLGSARAQLLSVQPASGDSVVQVTADEAGLASVAATALPRSGTFWVMTTGSNGRLMALPYPLLPTSLSTLPIYSVSGNTFIVDDTGGQLAPSPARRMSSIQAASAMQAQAAMMANLIEQIQTPAADSGDSGFQFNYNFSFDTNGLWIEILNTNGVTTNLWLRLHNTVGGDNYQLLSTTNLVNHGWDLGQILTASADTMDFSPVPITNSTAFFKAHQANPAMWIEDAQDSLEPNPTNSDPGQIGIFYIQNEGWATNDVTVHYTIGGTAQNGIDYSNLTGAVVVPVSSYYAEIDIDPIADGLKPDQTVILTLRQNTNYLIDPVYYSATNILYANPEVYPIANGDREPVCPNTPFSYTLGAQDPRNLPLTYSILTWPTHGTLTGTPPYMTYTPTNCYEGQDSFTFKVNDGYFDSAPATVTLIISDTVYANPVSAQTCRGVPVSFSLNAGDSCGEATNYAISTPAHGTVTNISGQDYVYTPTGTNFTGTNSFNYMVYDNCGDAATSTVTITVGDQNISANPQTAMTGTNHPIVLTLSAQSSLGCTNAFTYTVVSGPTNGTLTGTGANRTYTPTNHFEGVDGFIFAARDGVWSNSQAQVTIYVVAGPTNLTAQCASNGPGILLNWGLDDKVQEMENDDGLPINGFEIYRRASPGLFTTNNIIYTTSDSSHTNYLDVMAAPGTTNYYKVDFFNSITNRSPYSNEATNIACFPPSSGTNGVDVVFILDNTGSMWRQNGSMEIYQDAITNAVTYIEDSSGGNCRFALVTPDTDGDEINGTADGHDMVDVRIGFTNNVTAFEAAVTDSDMGGSGGAWPESTDECLNTVVNALAAAGRQDTNNCASPDKVLQIGDFRPAFRTNAVKLVVLITDAGPSGFCDAGGFSQETTNQAHLFTLEAATNHIRINAIEMGEDPYGGFGDEVTPVMQDYATSSCGWYSQVSDYSDSSGIENAMLEMLYMPNECNQ